MNITTFFVYGTLKQGHRNSNCWPKSPLSIATATIEGELYDLGDYPALIEGGSLVQGELWEFASKDIPVTVAALDRVEWFQQDDHDLYIRRVASAFRTDGQVVCCYCYYFANKSDLVGVSKIRRNADGLLIWTE